MKYNSVRYTYLFCSVLVLNGCIFETNDNYKVQNNILPENPGQASYEDKGGLAGKVIVGTYVKGAKICFDDNLNGFCDITEASEVSYEGGKFSFEKSISEAKQEAVLIAQVPIVIPLDDGSSDTNTQVIVLSANQVDAGEAQTQTITPYTSMVVNEQLYNPYVNENKAEALIYLAKTNVSNQSTFEGEDYIASSNTDGKQGAKDLVNAFTQAFALKENDPYFAIANVVDKVVKEKRLKVNISALHSQNRLDQNLSLIDQNKITSSQKLHKDELTLGSSFAEGVKKIVTFSKWHNKLTIIDGSDVNVAPKLLDDNKFIYVNGERDDIDTTTGASEQQLSSIEISSDGGTIYSMLGKSESDSEGTGVGIYLSDISSSIVPDTIFATVSDSEKYFKYEDITNITLSQNGEKFGACGDDKKIYLFDAGSLRSATHEIVSPKKVKAITISEDNSVVFAGLNQKFKNSIGLFETLSKNLVGEFLLDKYPTSILEINQSEIFVASSEENKIYHLDISDKNNIKQLALITASAKVKELQISNDGKYLIATLTTKQVNVFDISNTSKVASIGLDDIVVDAFDVADNDIAVIYGQDVAYFKITEGSGNLSDIEKQAWKDEHR